VVCVLACIVYGLATPMPAFLDFSGCPLVCTSVKKWWCEQVAPELGFSI
jgi:hypothetical protein